MALLDWLASYDVTVVGMEATVSKSMPSATRTASYASSSASATTSSSSPCPRPPEDPTYFDTSALVKLVVIEDDSDLAAELWETRHPAGTSMLSFLAPATFAG